MSSSASFANTVATHNQTGWCTSYPSALNLAFIEFAAAQDGPALEIGGGIGLVAHLALQRGIKIVYNDISEAHSDAFKMRLAADGRAIPPIVIGAFPGEMAFADDTFAAIHASNVVHFLTPGDFARGLADVRRWLKPGGRVFLQTSNAYVGNFRAFIPVFEQRQREGLPNPGFVEDIHPFVVGHPPDLVPKQMLLMTGAEVRAALEAAGLRVRELFEYRREGLAEVFHYDGRENVAAIAEKA